MEDIPHSQEKCKKKKLCLSKLYLLSSILVLFAYNDAASYFSSGVSPVNFNLFKDYWRQLLRKTLPHKCHQSYYLITMDGVITFINKIVFWKEKAIHNHSVIGCWSSPQWITDKSAFESKSETINTSCSYFRALLASLGNWWRLKWEGTAGAVGGKMRGEEPVLSSPADSFSPVPTVG